MIAPLLIFVDILVTTYQVYSSVSIQGGKLTIFLLWKHGVIELPNLILYMYLSYKAFYHMLKNPKFKTLISYFNENKYVYLISYLLVIIAGIVEGLIG